MKLYDQISSYISPYSEEMNSKMKMLEFLDKYENPFARELKIGHFTGSAFLLNLDKTKFLLMNHTKLNKWLQLGGHCDGDENVLSVAIKEAKEESGILEIEPISTNIYDIDVHLIPSNSKESAHYHYDIRFLLKTVNDNNFIRNSESLELKWFNFNSSDYKNLTLDDSVIRMINKFRY